MKDRSIEKTIKELHLVFENCEVCIIPSKYISTFSIQNVKRSIQFSGKDSYDNPEYYREGYSTDRVYISLTNYDKLFSKFSKGEKDPLLNRLKCPDITHIDIIYSDKTNAYVSVPWFRDEPYTNYYQEYSVLSLKNRNKLVIKINDRITWEKIKRYVKWKSQNGCRRIILIVKRKFHK